MTPPVDVPKPIVAVLLVAGDDQEALRRTFGSLAVQEGVEPRAVLVDAGSADGSVMLDQEFPFVSVLRAQRYFGLTRTLNMGVKAAAAEFVVFAQPGHTFPAGSLAAMVEAVEAGAGAAAIRAPGEGFGDLPDAEALFAAWRAGQPWRPGGEPATAAGVALGVPLLVRKTFVQGMNYFDDKYGEAYPFLELFAQLRQAGKRLAVLEFWADAAAGTGFGLTRAELAADALNGIAVYAGKRGANGLSVRMRGILAAFVGMLTHPAELGYRLSVLSGVLGGSKVDGV
jgi:hypothetical protein